MKKKVVSLALALILVFAMAIPAMALNADGNWTEITKKEYDGFADKQSANNNIVGIGNLTLISNSKTGWWIVADDGVFGTVDVAYKIGNAYYLVTFEIRKESRTYFIGDGSGKNGVNHVKVGEFVPHVCGDDWILIERQAANCVEEGFEKYECDWCGETKTETLPIDRNNHKEEVTCVDCNICDACGVCECEVEPAGDLAEAFAYAYKGDGNNNFLFIDIYVDGNVVASYSGTYSQSETGGNGFTRTFDGYTVRIVVDNRGAGPGSDPNYINYPLDGTVTITGYPE